MIRNIFYAISSLALTATVGQAQERGTALQFLSFPLQVDIEPVELAVGKKKTIEVEIPSNELSAVYRAPALKSVVVGETVVAEDGTETFEIYGSAKSISARSQIILLIRKGTENSQGFTVIPVDGDLQTFGGGQFLFINASPISIGGILGDDKFSLASGKRTLVAPRPNVGKNLVQVTFSYMKDGKWKKFADRRWPIIKNSRALVFFYQDPVTNRLRLHAVRDRIGVARPVEQR